MNKELLSRRRLLAGLFAATCSAAVWPRSLFANTEGDVLSWNVFVDKINKLANDYAAKQVTAGQLTTRGLNYLQSLDISSHSFISAVASAYESGNSFWLWQRMLKQHNVNGGILNIDNKRVVQLHDHPGATGILRIISGEAEVWQYDRLPAVMSANTVKLQLVSRRILRAGDTAILSPAVGNIHALRSVSAECRMLDFFIPPYQQTQRTWFEPLNRNWQEQQQLVCKAISQNDYMEV